MKPDRDRTILAVTQDSEFKFILERALKQERAYHLSVHATTREALLKLEGRDSALPHTMQ